MARMHTLLFFAVGLIGARAEALASVVSTQEAVNANPIRRVVSLLQEMSKKIEGEGANEKQLFDKFMCYCKKQRAESAQAIAETAGKAPQMAADVEEAEQKAKQLKMEIETARADVSAAQSAMSSAQERREQENKEFLAEKAELEGNIGALAKSIPVLEKLGGSFLQAQAGTKQLLLKAVNGAQELSEYDKDSVVSFLSDAESSSSPGEVVGILKSVNEDYTKNLASIEKEEAQRAELFEELMAAKTKQSKTLAGEIEKKTEQTGQLAVTIVNMKAEVESAERDREANEKFAAELEETCNARVAEYDKAVKARGEELTALADTVRVLNSDDALDLFKKTLPNPSLLQMQVDEKQQRKTALAIIRGMPHKNLAPHLDFLSMSLSGHKANFGKLRDMIDGMLAILKQQGEDDESQLEYCRRQIALAQDKAKGLKTKIEDAGHEIEEHEQVIESTSADIKAVEASIKSLDQSVEEATEQRKAEHGEYVENTSMNSASKQLLQVAKDRMNKFYNPGTARPSESLTQISKHTHMSTRQASSNVIALLDKLIKGLDKEMTESKFQEEDAQKDYERLMEDSTAKRATAGSEIREKENILAEAESSKAELAEASATQTAELDATGKYAAELHGQCDWLSANADLRKQSRKDQGEQLQSAKDVLAGANLSLLQGPVRMGKRLRGSA